MDQYNKIIENLMKGIINILYSPVCPICGNILRVNNNEICKDCKNKIKYLNEPTCKKCGKQLIQEEQEYCYDCSKKEHSYTRGLALCIYDDTIRKSIYNLKYNNKREYAKVYANEIILHYKPKILKWEAEALIPIPLHISRMRKRGFNQAEDLGRELAKQLELPLLTRYVKRVKKTIPQKELNHKQRRNNLKKAFKIVDNDVKLKKVILIDDIYTTGATIDSIAELLKESGVVEIYFITISIGEGF